MPEATSVDSVRLKPRDADAGIALVLSRLPNSPARLWVGSDDETAGLEPIQVVEAAEYRYKIEGSGVEGVKTDRPEMFASDEASGRSGRFRPGEHTGLLTVSILSQSEAVLGTFGIEIRSLKVSYLTDYRVMLEDISSNVAGIVSQYFAPSEQRFTPVAADDPETVYQRFAFLKSIVCSHAFQAAIEHVTNNPHRQYILDEGGRPTAQGGLASARAIRALTSSGPRQRWPGSAHHVLQSLPLTVPSSRSIETLDTAENRFIKTVLRRWTTFAAEVSASLERVTPKTPAVERGLREVEETVRLLVSSLSNPMFKQVGDMRFVPYGSSVLQKRSGYREVFRLHAQTELAASLAWVGGEDVYRAGQKNVAKLYEYWVFFKMVELVSGMCALEPLDLSGLFATEQTGLSLALKRGKHHVLSGALRRSGRRVQVELHYNRWFRPSDEPSESGSWSVSMWPDLSIRLRIEPSLPGPFVDEVWLHFDAKYKIENAANIFGNVGEEASSDLAAKHGDILKMHAYRDAVRRTSGAYVLYPGDVERRFTEYSEVLPGLGAFPLRPTEERQDTGEEYLSAFLHEVADHLIATVTQHERYRYWTRKSFGEPQRVHDMPDSIAFGKPARDVPALLVRLSTLALQWVMQTNRIAIPVSWMSETSKGRGVIGCEVVVAVAESNVFIGRLGYGAEVWAEQELTAGGYPAPAPSTAIVLPIAALYSPTDWGLSAKWLAEQTSGAPPCTVVDLASAIDASRR